MKKKFMLFGLITLLGITLFGCGKTTSDYVRDNLSECTTVYFYGECENFYATLSSGKREKTYLVNGKSEDKVDFSLLSVNLNSMNSVKLIKAKVTIDGVVSEQELEVGGISSQYMVDLEKKLTGSEKIEIEYNGEKLVLQNVSKDFVVDADKALDIASKQLESKICLLKNGSNLNAECYLRVMDKKANKFDDLFWCFTVVNARNENYSIIISTVDGSVLAKSE